MKRAIQTAAYFESSLNKSKIVLEDLRDWKVGSVEKKPWVNSLLGIPISEWPNPPGDSISWNIETVI